LTSKRGGWLYSFRLVWHPVAILLPVALAVLAATGYYYTAQQLAGRMLAGGYLLLGLTLARSFLLRWVLVRRRKLAIARQRRAAALAEAASAGNESGVSQIIIASNEPKLDLATINVQTQRFVEYSLALAGLLGMWLVWVDVLPALRALDKIGLWQAEAQAEWTSLADFSLAALIFATALIAAKNAPGLLEMALLQRLPLDAGVRYTINTVSRYIIGVVGILVSCHMIGLTWSTVQWLVAAISVGLGFGLQEIFANFVSGLIILFERPVRVGDVVTVADTTGVISRIRMRATTITNWDRKEFIVPNKEFITGRLLNWTLSDKVNRIVVNVGIAYGSDTTLATDLILKIAREHPLILDEPAPRVAFEEFGASSLNYVLRCFLPDMENRLQVIHELHIAIDREFRQAGIEIAFPQQDVHVRSIHAIVRPDSCGQHREPHR
jgi:potassium efflux system protein